MCGIAGILTFENRPQKLEGIGRIVRALGHRGPDGEGFLFFHGPERKISVSWPLNYSAHQPTPFSDAPVQNYQLTSSNRAYVAFGHRRLSIIDTSPSGHQPMCTPDGRLAIILNGEIYNYLELRAELEGLGHLFRSRSDTEVLLIAYKQWGLEALNRLNGMFAFAILDTQRQSLLMARDFFGIKPLYYTRQPEGLAFASEIAGLLELPGVSRRVNPKRLHDYLHLFRTDHGDETMFGEIRQLQAAHYLEISLDRPTEAKPVPYWHVDLNQQADLSFEDAAEKLRHEFLETVNFHVRSDVPIGAALSGGTDSSSVTLAISQALGRGQEFHTFSYISSDPVVNEEQWIDLAAQAAGAITHKFGVEAVDIRADFDQVMKAQGEPFGSPVLCIHHRLFQLAHQAGIKVILGGQGGDEVLGGYPSFFPPKLASLIRNGHLVNAGRFLHSVSRPQGAKAARTLSQAARLVLPTHKLKFARRLNGAKQADGWMNDKWFADRGAVLTTSRKSSGRRVFRESLWRMIAETNMPAMLRFEDRNAMASSVEYRVPFLSPKLVNFLFSLPEDYLIALDGTTKAVFRRAMRGLVPDGVLDRKDKIGFGIPWGGWLAELRPWVDDVLKGAGGIHPLKADYIARYWEEVRAGRNITDRSVFLTWRWIALIKWAQNFAVEFD